MIRLVAPAHCAQPLALLALLFSASAVAAAAETEAVRLFEEHVRPTLIDHCIRCHGEQKQQGGLRLDSREGWIAGGDSGPAILPGKPDASILVGAVRYQNVELQMPPRGTLPEATIAAIEKWVQLGAHRSSLD